MMNFGYGMGYSSGFFGLLGIIFWLVLFVDAILLGIWLWRQIQK